VWCAAAEPASIGGPTGHRTSRGMFTACLFIAPCSPHRSVQGKLRHACESDDSLGCGMARMLCSHNIWDVDVAIRHFEIPQEYSYYSCMPTDPKSKTECRSSAIELRHRPLPRQTALLFYSGHSPPACPALRTHTIGCLLLALPCHSADQRRSELANALRVSSGYFRVQHRASGEAPADMDCQGLPQPIRGGALHQLGQRHAVHRFMWGRLGSRCPLAQ
jgi:hypothetical protein